MSPISAGSGSWQDLHATMLVYAKRTAMSYAFCPRLWIWLMQDIIANVYGNQVSKSCLHVFQQHFFRRATALHELSGASEALRQSPGFHEQIIVASAV